MYVFMHVCVCVCVFGVYVYVYVYVEQWMHRHMRMCMCVQPPRTKPVHDDCATNHTTTIYADKIIKDIMCDQTQGCLMQCGE